MQNAVLVSYSVSKWNNVRTDKKVGKAIAKQHGISSKAGRYQKVLIDSALYKAITDAGQYGRDKFYAYTLPWQHGVSIVNIKALDVLRDEIVKAEVMFNESVDTFMDQYPALVERASETLGPIFNRHDYPDADSVRDKFAIDFQITPIVRDGHFDDIAEIVGTEVAQELAKKLSEQQEKQWQGAAKSVRHKLYKALKHAHDAMLHGKRLHASSLDNLRELSDLLPILNINNDSDLDDRRRELNALLKMYSIQAVQDKPTRNQCASDVHAIMAKINL